MKPWAKKFYNSKAWKECRASYIVKVHGLCERCSKPGKIVHHKKYLTPYNINDPNITLSHSNLEYVCQDCHNNEHHGDGPAGQGFMFDEEGNLVQREDGGRGDR